MHHDGVMGFGNAVDAETYEAADAYTCQRQRSSTISMVSNSFSFSFSTHNDPTT